MRNYSGNMNNVSNRPPTRYQLEKRAKTICKTISPTKFYRQELVSFIPTCANDFNIVGYCPFHPGLWGDSFKVHLKYGAYNCKYCGKAGSNIVEFYRQYHGVSLQTAVESLEERMGKKKRSSDQRSYRRY